MKKGMGIITLIICLSIFLSFVSCSEKVITTTNDNQLNNADNNVNNANNDIINNSAKEISMDAPQFDMPDDVDLSEHITINYMGRNTNNPDINIHTFVKDRIEDLFNITFDFSPASGKNNDMELIAAADAVPECAWIYLGSTDKAWSLYRDGLTRSIPMDYVQKYAPYMWIAMQDDKSFHHTQLVPETEDEYYVLFAMRYNMYKLGSGTVVRMDWLENLGILPKGNNIETIVEDHVYITDEAYLLNEFTDILYDFTYSDPDMNGENDTIGLDAFGLTADDYAYGGLLYSAFSIKNTYTPNENNWAVPLIFSDANFKFFKQLGEWKSLGVLPTGFENKVANDWIKMWSSGKYGASAFEQKQLSIDINKYGKDGFIDDSMPLILFNNNPDAKIILAPPLLNNDGTGGHGRSYGDYIRSSDIGYFYVREDVSDEKLKRILMVYDYMSNNPDGADFCRNGIQGIHWGYDENNNRIILEQDDLPDNEKWEGYDYFRAPNAVNSELITSFITLEPKNEGTFLNVREAMRAYSETNWPSLGYTYVEADLPNNWLESYEWMEMSNMQARNKAYKAARTALIEETADPDTIWENLMGLLDTLGYQEYLEGLNNHAYLRDELFFEGLAITPAEKFPLN